LRGKKGVGAAKREWDHGTGPPTKQNTEGSVTNITGEEKSAQSEE